MSRLNSISGLNLIKIEFSVSVLGANNLGKAFIDIIKYVQHNRFGAAVGMLQKESPDAFNSMLRKLNVKTTCPEEMRRLAELKSLRNLRPCVDEKLILRIDGRFENAELPVDAKHPIILPSRHPLTRSIALNEHVDSGRAGPTHTLMKTKLRFWLIFGISSAKRILSDCSKCARRKATPIRQLMADLPACRVTACNKPFKFCRVDYFGPYIYRQGRSDCKTWGLLVACMCTRAVLVEIVTGWT